MIGWKTVDQPNEYDWLNIINDIRTVFGWKKLAKPVGIPSDEFLKEYDAVVPGTSQQLKEMAEKEMRHRISLERRKT